MIEVENLHVIYKPGNIVALRGVSAKIPLHEVTCIIGPNASGKTTLLKAIAGLVKYTGSIKINGRSTRELESQLRKTLSFTPSASSLNRQLGARVVNILLAALYPVKHSFADTREDIERVVDIAREVGITHLLTRDLSELSAGELQRVVLAAALIKDPEIILLDEPDAHLDIQSKVWLSSYLKNLAREKTVLISTHDIIFALNTCKYFVVLRNGTKFFEGNGEDLVSYKYNLEEVYGVELDVVNVNGRKLLLTRYH